MAAQDTDMTMLHSASTINLVQYYSRTAVLCSKLQSSAVHAHGVATITTSPHVFSLAPRQEKREPIIPVVL